MTSRQIVGGGGGGGGAGGGDVVIVDGVDNGIKNTVFDLAGSNPVTVAIVDGAGAQVTSFGGTGGTSMTDDAAFTPGTTPITPVGGTYRSTRDAVTDNDGGALAMTEKRGLYVSIETPAADSAMDDTLNTLNVSIPAGAVASGAILSGAVASGAIASGAVASGAIASGAVASGAIASGAVASGAFASGALASGSIAAGAIAAGATSIAANEDDASADLDRGVKILFKRLDTPANASGTDGDYEQPQMSAGRIWASAVVTANALPTGAATLAEQQAETALLTTIDGDTGGILTAVQIMDDWDESDRAKVNPIVGQAGVAGGTGVDAATVQRVSLATNVPLPAGTNNIGDVDVLSSALPTGASTLAEQQSQTTALQIMDDWDNAASDGASVSGDVAHDTADAGEPVKIGGKAIASSLAQTLVAANDRTNGFFDLDGTQLSGRGVALGDLISERASNTDGASTVLTTFGATASQRNMITAITVHNAHATTNGYVDIRDGAAGAILWTLPLPATGGAVQHFDPPLRQPTQNTALAFDVSAAITTIYLSFNGFKTKL